MMEKVSVIIPLYNKEKTIANTIQSVLRQSLPVYEIIVVNDGSTDQSKKAIEPFMQHILFLEQENKGVSHTTNWGIKASTGDYIAFLDADDLWLPLKTELQIRYLQKNTEMSGCFTLTKQINTPEELEMLGGIIQSGFSKSCLMLKAAIARANLFDEQLRMGDFIAWYATMQRQQYKFGMVEELLVGRLKVPASLSQENNYQSNLIKILHQKLKQQNNT